MAQWHCVALKNLYRALEPKLIKKISKMDMAANFVRYLRKISEAFKGSCAAVLKWF